jgi:hypothetical protein
VHEPKPATLENVPAGHGKQLALLVPPGVGPYVPAGQKPSHSTVPVLVWNVPENNGCVPECRTLG